MISSPTQNLRHATPHAIVVKGCVVLTINLADDPGEQNDLAASNPEKLKGMLALWEQYVQDNSVFVYPDLEIKYTNGKGHYN